MNNKHLSWYKEINNNFIIASRAYYLQKVPETFDVRVKNVKSRTTAKVSVFAPHIPTSNLIIIKANLAHYFYNTMELYKGVIIFVEKFL